MHLRKDLTAPLPCQGPEKLQNLSVNCKYLDEPRERDDQAVQQGVQFSIFNCEPAHVIPTTFRSKSSKAYSNHSD